jgi:hypothetical protein
MSLSLTARLPRSKYYIGDCPLGKGVFAAQDIQAGEPVFQLNGRIITFEEVVGSGEKGPNCIQIGPNAYLDVGSPALFMNHSCAPNLGLRDDIIMVAVRDIRRHQEIRFDYSTCMSENCWSMQCLCGMPECRGTIRDFHDLPFELKVRYLVLDIVQRFIVKECLDTLTPDQWEQVRRASVTGAIPQMAYLNPVPARSFTATQEDPAAREDDNNLRVTPAFLGPR